MAPRLRFDPSVSFLRGEGVDNVFHRTVSVAVRVRQYRYSSNSSRNSAYTERSPCVPARPIGERRTCSSVEEVRSARRESQVDERIGESLVRDSRRREQRSEEVVSEERASASNRHQVQRKVLTLPFLFLRPFLHIPSHPVSPLTIPVYRPQ